jgi:probable HAF family extracellular repeat protein
MKSIRSIFSSRFTRQLLALVACSAMASSTWAAYSITDLGGFLSVPTGINNYGQVVGYSTDTETHIRHPFLYANGSMSDLGTFGGNDGAATSINDNGQVVGWSATSGYSFSHAFLYANGDMSDLGTFGGSSSLARSINNSGQAVGVANTTGASHAFLYANGSMSDLGTLGGVGSDALSINNSGQVVGWSHRAALFPMLFFMLMAACQTLARLVVVAV